VINNDSLVIDFQSWGLCYDSY